MGRRLVRHIGAGVLAGLFLAAGCGDTPENTAGSGSRPSAGPGVRSHPGSKLQVNPNSKMPQTGSRTGSG